MTGEFVVTDGSSLLTIATQSRSNSHVWGSDYVLTKPKLMNTSTIKIIEVALKADPTVSLVLRNKILKLARNGVQEPPDEKPSIIGLRIYSRDEVAYLLGGRSTRYIDQLVRRGLLQKFIPKGNRRPIGICGKSLHAFIEGN